MQYPVPQFTDVEDKIIGPLTVKQFGIIFAGGIIIFLAYSVTKSLLVLIFFGVLVGIPTLTFAFGKINGRSLYKVFPVILRFLTSEKVMVFHRETVLKAGSKIATVDTKAKKKEEKSKVELVGTPEEKLLKLNEMLEHQAKQEEDLIKRI